MRKGPESSGHRLNDTICRVEILHRVTPGESEAETWGLLVRRAAILRHESPGEIVSAFRCIAGYIGSASE